MVKSEVGKANSQIIQAHLGYSEELWLYLEVNSKPFEGFEREKIYVDLCF